MNYVSFSTLVMEYKGRKRITFMRYNLALSECYSDATSTAILFIANIKPHPFEDDVVGYLY